MVTLNPCPKCSIPTHCITKCGPCDQPATVEKESIEELFDIGGEG